MFAGIVYPNPFENDPILFLLAALPCCAGWAAAHPAILPDTSAVVRPDTTASDRTVYLRVDEPPRFRGEGVLAFRDWVLRHLRFGAEMFREGVDARLVVSFVVGRQGAVEEPEVVSSTDERCSAEVLRVLASAPRWTPGRLGNVAVRTKLVMPVNIQLAVPTAADSLAAGLSDGIPLEEDVAGELERMPLFQGGDLQSFRKWVMENLKYPREALEDEVEDDIVVTFIVEKDGTLSEIVVEQGLNLALIREVGRVLTLSPKWEPGRLGNGEPVQVRYTLPLIFRLDRTRPAGQPVRPSVPGREVRVGVDDYSRFNPYYLQNENFLVPLRTRKVRGTDYKQVKLNVKHSGFIKLQDYLGQCFDGDQGMGRHRRCG